MTDIRHLGTLSGPLFLSGGIYSNLEALTAFADKVKQTGIAPQNVIHTGDVIAYCSDHAACLNKLRDLGWQCMKGNVEQQLANEQDDCACGFADGSACSILSDNWFANANTALDSDQRQWLKSMADQLEFTYHGKTVRVVHGAADNISRFIFASAADAVFEKQFALTGADIIIAGHCGIPFTRRLGNKIWHNPGALGMPANDGTPRVWYSQMFVDNDTITFRHLPLQVEFKATANKMRTNGLPEAYARALQTGLWPSLDVLPDAEVAATGRPLAPK